MTVVEGAAEDLFPALGQRAESRLPARWIAIRERLQQGVILAVIVAVQAAWLTAFAYAAYVFVL